MRRVAWGLLGLALACGEFDPPALDAGRPGADAEPALDAEAPRPAPPCGVLELNLPVSLLGPGASHRLWALVHPPAGEGFEPTLVSPELASVRVLGEAVVWRRDRFVAMEAGAAEVHVELGGCQSSATIEVLGYAPFGAELLEVSFGRGAGHGASELPEIVLGPPAGGGAYAGSLDVLSLGIGGSISLGFGALQIYDGPGPDFIVFENAFLVAGGAAVFAEPAEVSILRPDATWGTFRCDHAYPHEGCAGRSPVLSNPMNERAATDPAAAGGDAFDLAELTSLADALRLEDVGTATTGSNSGFDLDAVALVHAWPRDVVALTPEHTSLSIIAGSRRLLPTISALRRDGSRLLGVAVHVAVEHPEILSIEGPVLRGLRPGFTRLVVRAGPFQTTIDIEVSSS